MSASKRRPIVIDSAGCARARRCADGRRRRGTGGTDRRDPAPTGAPRALRVSDCRALRGDSMGRSDPTPPGRARASRARLCATSTRCHRSGLRFALTGESINRKDTRVGASGNRGIRGHRMRTGGRRRHAGPRNRIRALRRAPATRPTPRSTRSASACGASVNGNVRVSRDPRGAARTRRSSSRRSSRTREAKAAIWSALGRAPAPTTRSWPRPRPPRCRSASSPSASGHPERFVGLHVFNPVPKMDLVELAFPDAATDATRERARALCAALGKTAVEVPDTPGFVVNRLLFPFLFEAVRLMERTGLERRGDRHLHAARRRPPDGPARAAGPRRPRRQRRDRAARSTSRSPRRIDALIAEGALGRKTGRGFHTY